MVWVGVGAHNHAYVTACSTPQAVNVFGICGAWVNHKITSVWIADQIAIGARAGHHARVRGGETLHVFE
jgi:hypothetical protein